jgi:uncharacterized protein
MILYLDTSALVKRYFEEPYADEVLDRWRQALEIITSSVAYAETVASFYRKKREADLDEGVIEKVLQAFHLDWKSFLRVEVNDKLNEIIDRIAQSYPLRGFDAIHLASAVLVKKNLPSEFLFVCFDQKLAQAALEEGLEIFPTKLFN